jgi:nitrite reductase/ring-hydroxylating ferredoxin subunit
VLALGLLGDQGGEPKVACPLHKKTFSLETGKGLSDPAYSVATFPVRIEGNQLQVKLPPADALLAAVCSKAGRCHS